MKALKVFEVANFERGGNVFDKLGIGITEWLKNFDRNYFKLSTEDRIEAADQFDNIMSKIGFEEIPVNSDHFPLELIFGRRSHEDYRQFKLDHGLYLTFRDEGKYSSAYVTDEKGKPISYNDSSSAGRRGVNTILARARKTKKLKKSH